MSRETAGHTAGEAQRIRVSVFRAIDCALSGGSGYKNGPDCRSSGSESGPIEAVNHSPGMDPPIIPLGCYIQGYPDQGLIMLLGISEGQ